MTHMFKIDFILDAIFVYFTKYRCLYNFHCVDVNINNTNMTVWI